MTWQRRQVLKGLGAISLAYGIPKMAWAQQSPLLLSCARQGDGDYLLTYNLQGQQVSQYQLPHRGHGVAPVPATLPPNAASALVFGRRPGQYIAHVDCLNGQLIDQYTYPAGRHGYGHGTFDAQGLLYVSEGISSTSQGVIGIYQLKQGKLVRKAEWLLPAIGPHEIVLHPNLRHLVVAVGGIHTRGRDKLNLDNMSPALLYIELASGEVKQTVTLAERQLSIRHLAAADDGQLVFACQDQAEDNDMLPLVYRHRLGQAHAVPLQAEPEQWLRFEQYVGSVAVQGQRVWASSPRGNCLASWDIRSGKLLGQQAMTDVCGIATGAQGVSFSAGNGHLHHQQTWLTPWHFDNHMAQWG